MCNLCAVSKLARCFALMVLALWGLAAMHCKLEALPGMAFLRSCCFADSSSASPKDCETDSCGAVEDGKYRPEELNASAPHPVLVSALLLAAIEAPLPELMAHPFTVAKPPPELPRSWQFSLRAALPPRAPSLVG